MFENFDDVGESCTLLEEQGLRPEECPRENLVLPHTGVYCAAHRIDENQLMIATFGEEQTGIVLSFAKVLAEFDQDGELDIRSVMTSRSDGGAGTFFTLMAKVSGRVARLGEFGELIDMKPWLEPRGRKVNSDRLVDLLTIGKHRRMSILPLLGVISGKHGANIESMVQRTFETSHPNGLRDLGGDMTSCGGSLGNRGAGARTGGTGMGTGLDSIRIAEVTGGIGKTTSGVETTVTGIGGAGTGGTGGTGIGGQGTDKPGKDGAGIMGANGVGGTGGPGKGDGTGGTGKGDGTGRTGGGSGKGGGAGGGTGKGGGTGGTGGGTCMGRGAGGTDGGTGKDGGVDIGGPGGTSTDGKDKEMGKNLTCVIQMRLELGTDTDLAKLKRETREVAPEWEWHWRERRRCR